MSLFSILRGPDVNRGVEEFRAVPGAVLLVSHDWDMVRHYADRAILLEKKVLAEGTPDEVFSSEAFDRAFPLKR